MRTVGWRDWVRRLFTSPPARVRSFRPRLEPLEDRTVPTTFFVTNTGDTGTQTGNNAGDLRYCINNATAGSTIDFSMLAPGSQTITLTAELTVTKDLNIDGKTHLSSSGTPDIILDGVNHSFDGLHLTSTAGGSTIQSLVIDDCYRGIFVDSAGGVTIRGNFIGNNTNAGVSLSDSSNDFIQGNTIGVTSAGDKAANGVGVLITSGSHGPGVSSIGNTIGGLNPGTGNVISGNTLDGVQLNGPAVSGTTVEGNFIGVNAAGDEELGNGGNGVSLREGTNGSVIGAAGAPNVISGNGGSGVLLDGGSFDTRDNRIEDNYIGTDITGVQNLGNAGDGVSLLGRATNNLIGGPSPGEGNVISGNTLDGVLLDGFHTTGNTVEGNLIQNNADCGVVIQGGANGNIIGGIDSSQANTISGNVASGVRITDVYTSGNTVEGNTIQNNADYGVVIQGGASFNTIGGTTTADQNTISGNFGAGVLITDSGTSSNTIEGNTISDNVAGSGASPNQGEGVAIVNGASNNTIGIGISGPGYGLGNVISGNSGDGVLLDGSGTNFNTIAGNDIGTDETGTNPLGNIGDGVRIQNGAVNNNVGMFSGEGPSGAPNVIAFNAKGVVVVGDSTSNQISQNSIFGNAGPGIDLGDDGPTPNGTAGPGPNDFLNHPEITSVTSNEGSAEVIGFLNAAPSTPPYPFEYQIEVFASPANGDPFQGETFLGSFQVPTDATGLAKFDQMVAAPPSGWVVDATATDVGGDTSEFSSGPPVSFVVSAPSNIDEQDPFAVTVQAVDANGQTTPSFLGTVALSTNDPRTSLPASYTFTAADAGVHTFSGVRLLTPGAETLAVNGSGLTGSAVVNVSDTAPTVFLDPVLPAAAGTTVLSQGHFTDPDGASWTATVDYGDNSGLQPLVLAPDHTFQLQHVYAHEGSYAITVVVTDESGVSSTPVQTLAEVFIAGTDPSGVGVGKAGQGQTITVSAPGVTAMLTHNGSGNAYLLVTPVPPLGNAAFTLLTAGPGGPTQAVSYDVRGVNLSDQDRLVVRFSYPAKDPAPQLFFFDSSAGIFRAVPSVVNFADHTVTVVLTGGTKPSVSDLNGTVFTITTSPIALAAVSQNTGTAGPIYISNQSGAVGSGGLGGALASAFSLFGVGTVAISDGGGGGGDDSSNASPQTAVQEILNDLSTSTTTNADAGTPPGTAVLSPSQATPPDGSPDKAAPDDGKKPLPPPAGPGALRLWLTAPPAEGFDADGTRPAVSAVATAGFGAVQRWVIGATLAGVLPFAVLGLQPRKDANNRDLKASGGRKPLI